MFHIILVVKGLETGVRDGITWCRLWEPEALYEITNKIVVPISYRTWGSSEACCWMVVVGGGVLVSAAFAHFSFYHQRDLFHEPAGTYGWVDG